MKSTRSLVIAVLATQLLAQNPDPTRRPRGGFGVSDEAFKALLAKYDENKDGKIERNEYPRADSGFANLDRDGNGAIEEADLDFRPARGNRRRPGGQRPAQRQAAPKLPQIGDVAPDFELKRLGAKDEDAKVKLSSFAGDRPVALIFGSYT